MNLYTSRIHPPYTRIRPPLHKGLLFPRGRGQKEVLDERFSISTEGPVLSSDWRSSNKKVKVTLLPRKPSYSQKSLLLSMSGISQFLWMSLVCSGDKWWRLFGSSPLFYILFFFFFFCEFPLPISLPQFLWVKYPFTHGVKVTKF